MCNMDILGPYLTKSNVVDWVSALGTVGAFIGAFIVILRDYKLRQRQQASQVSAWANIKPSTPKQIADNPLSANYQIVVKNASSQPIFKSEAVLYVDGTLEQMPVKAPVVGPNEKLESMMYASARGGAVKLFVGLVDHKFTDSLGQRWHRSFDGKLKKIKHDD